MAYKRIPNAVKVEALKEAIILKDAKEIAAKYDISEKTIQLCYNKVINNIDEIIKNEKPGPKKKNKEEKKALKLLEFKPKTKAKEEVVCSNCGSTKVVKNGTYFTVNFLSRMIMLLLPFINLNQNKRIQKYICNDCKASIVGRDREINTYLRQAIKLQIGRLICILRFKHGLSIRAISHIIKSLFGVNGSVGQVTNLCTAVSKNAKEKLDTINNCTQNEAKMMIFDETFPKAKSSDKANLGVIVDENGLIRAVRNIVKKKRI